MTYAEPPGSWVVRKSAVASADVQIDSSGTCSPLRASRAARSRGVKIELFVSTRNRRPRSTSRSRNSAAPGSAFSSWTSTPSMSVSQHSAGRRSVVTGATLVGGGCSDLLRDGPAGGVPDVPGDAEQRPGDEHPEQDRPAEGPPEVAEVLGPPRVTVGGPA